jgi:hypothetical protein
MRDYIAFVQTKNGKRQHAERLKASDIWEAFERADRKLGEMKGKGAVCVTDVGEGREREAEEQERIAGIIGLEPAGSGECCGRVRNAVFGWQATEPASPETKKKGRAALMKRVAMAEREMEKRKGQRVEVVREVKGLKRALWKYKGGNIDQIVRGLERGIKRELDGEQKGGGE